MGPSGTQSWRRRGPPNSVRDILYFPFISGDATVAAIRIPRDRGEPASPTPVQAGRTIEFRRSGRAGLELPAVRTTAVALVPSVPGGRHLSHACRRRRVTALRWAQELLAQVHPNRPSVCRDVLTRCVHKHATWPSGRWVSLHPQLHRGQLRCQARYQRGASGCQIGSRPTGMAPPGSDLMVRHGRVGSHVVATTPGPFVQPADPLSTGSQRVHNSLIPRRVAPRAAIAWPRADGLRAWPLHGAVC